MQSSSSDWAVCKICLKTVRALIGVEVYEACLYIVKVVPLFTRVTFNYWSETDSDSTAGTAYTDVFRIRRNDVSLIRRGVYCIAVLHCYFLFSSKLQSFLKKSSKWCSMVFIWPGLHVRAQVKFRWTWFKFSRKLSNDDCYLQLCSFLLGALRLRNFPSNNMCGINTKWLQEQFAVCPLQILFDSMTHDPKHNRPRFLWHPAVLINSGNNSKLLFLYRMFWGNFPKMLAKKNSRVFALSLIEGKTLGKLKVEHWNYSIFYTLFLWGRNMTPYCLFL